jgi:hypothetical protein
VSRGSGRRACCGSWRRTIRGAQGGWVLSGMAVETEEVRPYGPWRDVLRGVPESVLGNELRSDLSRLLPGGGDRSAGPVDRGQLFDAFAAALLALTRASGPGLIVLDDVHWLDDSSAALLHLPHENSRGGAAPHCVRSPGRRSWTARRMITKVVRALKTARPASPGAAGDPLVQTRCRHWWRRSETAADAPEIFSVCEGQSALRDRARTRPAGGPHRDASQRSSRSSTTGWSVSRPARSISFHGPPRWAPPSTSPCSPMWSATPIRR